MPSLGKVATENPFIRNRILRLRQSVEPDMASMKNIPTVINFDAVDTDVDTEIS